MLHPARGKAVCAAARSKVVADRLQRDAKCVSRQARAASSAQEVGQRTQSVDDAVAIIGGLNVIAGELDR
jgi:hypothetical protein